MNLGYILICAHFSILSESCDHFHFDTIATAHELNRITVYTSKIAEKLIQESKRPIITRKLNKKRVLAVTGCRCPFFEIKVFGSPKMIRSENLLSIL